MLSYNGSSWSVTSALGSTRTLRAISCPATSFCAAVDTSGYALTYNGTAWSAPVDIDGSHALEAVSCTTATYCVAADNDGNVLTYNAPSWSPDQDIDSTRALGAIASSCAAGGASGYALSYSWDALRSQLTWDETGALALLLSDGTYDYVYGPGATPVEQVDLDSSTPTFMTYTPDGPTWLTTNAAGAETGFWGYDAYGTLAFGTPTSGFGYAGQYADATTGLYDMRARWYEPGTGEFTTVGPDLDSTGTVYAYAGDDPVKGSECAPLPSAWAR